MVGVDERETGEAFVLLAPTRGAGRVAMVMTRWTTLFTPKNRSRQNLDLDPAGQHCVKCSCVFGVDGWLARLGVMMEGIHKGP